MKMLWALLRWELRLQLRSTRSKVAIGFYLVLCSAPPVAFLLAAQTTLTKDAVLSPASFLEHLVQVQPFLTILLAMLLAGHRSATTAWPETWPVLASAPVSNAGYLLGRWAALVGLMIPLTLLPFFVAAGAATAAGCEWQSVKGWILSWLLYVLPMALGASALWLGMVTMLGGELPALGMTFIGVSLAMVLAWRWAGAQASR